MKYKIVIFDMDGTILDTLEDLANSLNFALRLSNQPERTMDEVRSFVGNGIRKLVERGVQPDAAKETVDQVCRDFSEYYRQHCSDKTRAYDGILKVIGSLRGNGIRTAVVSNKADFAVQQLCVQYFDGLFDVAAGEKADVRKKPAPDSIYEVLRLLKMGKQDAVYIGDSEVDIQTAQNAGIDCISVGWGFREKDFLLQCGAERVLERPEEIVSTGLFHEEILNIR